MQKLAETREDMELDVFVGDLNEGAMIARNNLHSDYDVIISRGGTAELIGQVTHIPVIEVTLSVYDILRAIKLAENYADRYAIVGFPAITKTPTCSVIFSSIRLIFLLSTVRKKSGKP